MSNCTSIQALLVAIMGFGFHHSTATAAQATPNGGLSSLAGWKVEWTKDFYDCFTEENAGPLMKMSSKDILDSSGTCESDDPAKYWLSLFIPLAEKESSFRDTLQDKGNPNQGLLQMEPKDMSAHGCKGDAKVARDNICCAIRIAGHLASQNTGGRASGNRGGIRQGSKSLVANNSGILDGFWEPMRVHQANKTADIKANSQQLCATNDPRLENPSGSSSGYKNGGSQ